MKPLFNNSTANQQGRIFTALILTGILSMSSGLTFIKTATANQISQFPRINTRQTNTEVLTDSIQTSSLPRIVANAVLRDVSQTTGIPRRQLEITNYQQQTWRNGCLDLPRPNEMCTMALVPGWRVIVSSRNQNWVYHTNNNGRQLRVANADSSGNNLPDTLPNSVRNRVLQAASRRLRLPINQVSIIQAEPRSWRNGCLELEHPGEMCTMNIVPGWRVVVGARDTSLIYHTNESGSQVRLNEDQSETPINDRKNVSDAVLQAASELTGLRRSQLRIVRWNQVTTDGCLSLPRPGEACTKIAMQAWEVTVIPQQQRRNIYQRLVYRATPDGSQVRLNEAASRISGSTNLPSSSKAVPIPSNELPPPLTRGMIFREIRSGGIAGQTYMTVLMDDGRLMRMRLGDANDSQRSVRWISPGELQAFEQLVERQRSEFRNINYPANRGAADFFVYTMTSSDGTVQYNDTSYDRLPANLQAVIQAWQQISQ
ncbi:MAG: hypothetical protein VKL59_13105 [Nostocaceae cyanobacterium]|nr:hypothetical protein [Nostocaceae cyanobacterium]